MKMFAMLMTLAATTTAASADDTYVSGGATFGGEGDPGGFYAGGTVEAGRRLSGSSLWVHGMVVGGKSFGFEEVTTHEGPALQLRLGIEGRSCTLDGALCMVAGLDGALTHVDHIAHYETINMTVPLVIARLGLDIGSRHVRVRPGIDVGFYGLIPAQGAITGAIAYQW